MKRSKHGLFVFPPKKTLIWRRHCSIGQSCCSMTSKRSIDCFLESPSGMKFFSRERSLNQPKASRVCICSINQSNRPISVRLLWLFCSRVVTSRTYENRSIKKIPFGSTCHNFFGDFGVHSFKTWKVSIHLQPNHFHTDSKGAIKSVHIKRVEFRGNLRAFVPQVQEKLSVITRCPY